MSLKDQILADISVFLNPDEHAESHVIDGVTLNCVINDSTFEDYAQEPGEGLRIKRMRIWVELSQLARPPKINKTMNIDGVLWTVTDSNLGAGMAEIKLERHLS